jgi:hypothetical protein
MSRSTKIALVVIGLVLLGSVPTIVGFVRAYYERSKLSRGMTADEVFLAADQWDLCINSYTDPKTQKFGVYEVVKEPSGQLYRVGKFDKTFRSKAEFLDFVDQQMSNGKPWNSQLTYFAGGLRNTYRVDFDSGGRVVNVSEMGGGP